MDGNDEGRTDGEAVRLTDLDLADLLCFLLDLDSNVEEEEDDLDLREMIEEEDDAFVDLEVGTDGMDTLDLSVEDVRALALDLDAFVADELVEEDVIEGVDGDDKLLADLDVSIRLPRPVRKNRYAFAGLARNRRP